jgi:hypothetical protein
MLTIYIYIDFCIRRHKGIYKGSLTCFCKVSQIGLVNKSNFIIVKDFGTNPKKDLRFQS